MKDYIRDRVIEEADYLIARECTVRNCATVLNISKSTVHTDMTKRLPDIDFIRYERVRRVLKKNFSERHIRGGNATREKYRYNKKK